MFLLSSMVDELKERWKTNAPATARRSLLPCWRKSMSEPSVSSLGFLDLRRRFVAGEPTAAVAACASSLSPSGSEGPFDLRGARGEFTAAEGDRSSRSPPLVAPPAREGAAPLSSDFLNLRITIGEYCCCKMSLVYYRASEGFKFLNSYFPLETTAAIEPWPPAAISKKNSLQTDMNE